jgi:hypothetical protein
MQPMKALTWEQVPAPSKGRLAWIDDVWFSAMGAASAAPFHMFAGAYGLALHHSFFWIVILLLPILYGLTRNRWLPMTLATNAVLMIAGFWLLKPWYVLAAPLLAPVVVAGVLALTKHRSFIRFKPLHHEQFIFGFLASACLMVPINAYFGFPLEYSLIPGILLLAGALFSLFHGSFMLRLTTPVNLYFATWWNLAPISAPGFVASLIALIIREIKKRSPT